MHNTVWHTTNCFNMKFNPSNSCMRKKKSSHVPKVIQWMKQGVKIGMSTPVLKPKLLLAMLSCPCTGITDSHRWACMNIKKDHQITRENILTTTWISFYNTQRYLDLKGTVFFPYGNNTEYKKSFEGWNYFLCKYLLYLTVKWISGALLLLNCQVIE